VLRFVLESAPPLLKSKKVFSVFQASITHKENLPKISIGIVVYNCVEHIRVAIESVVKQPYKHIELIIVDGGSNDGTLTVVDEFSDYISKVVSEKDKGIYDAMNKVCSFATGDWLIFLGCDDVLLASLANIAELMTDYDAIYYGDVILRSSGSVYGGKFSKLRLARMNFCHQALFYPRAVYKKYSYSLDYRWLADYAYNINLVGTGTTFIYVSEVISVFNDKGGSSFGDAEFEKRKLDLIRSSFGTPYVLLELLRRLIVRLTDKFANAFGVVLKRLLPCSCWKYVQSLWRRKRYGIPLNR
jgi:glycosyltransferase involved in cell wall biosynthesis